MTPVKLTAHCVLSLSRSSELDNICEGPVSGTGHCRGVDFGESQDWRGRVTRLVGTRVRPSYWEQAAGVRALSQSSTAQKYPGLQGKQ